ncbi:MAG: InlB B-repeat-containing protein [Butyricicoccus sp.]
MADKKDRPYLDWQVISITDKEGNTAGGTVAFDNNHLTYTPTADEAGKTVTITIRPKLGYVEEANTPLSFEIEVKKPVVEQSEFYVTMVIDGYGNAVAMPNSAKEGEEIQLTAIPDRGHHFKEWQATSGNIRITNDKFTMPAENVTVKAIFEADTYTVGLNANGGTIASGKDMTSYTYGVGATLPTKDDMTREGYTFDGWYDNNDFSGSSVTMISPTDTGAKAFYAKWTINSYSVTFNSNDGSDIDSQTVDYGNTVAEPTAPTKNGYTFAGWYSDEGLVSAYDFSTTVTSDITLYAKWTKNSSGGSYTPPTYKPTINQSDEGGTVSVDKTNPKKGDTVTITAKPDSGYQLDDLTVTDKNGKKLKLTDKGNGKYTFTMPASKVTVTPIFVKIAQQPTGKTFVDVDKSDWFADAVVYVTDKGLMNGTSSNTFSPNASTTRGMLMTVLARYAGEDTTGSTPWYQKGMEWAKANGVSDGTNPEVNITREQLVTMLYRYAGSPKANGSLDSFSDAASVSSYAVNAMQWAVANGIVNGSNGKLNPQNNATRAEVAAILMRFCEMSK